MYTSAHVEAGSRLLGATSPQIIARPLGLLKTYSNSPFDDHSIVNTISFLLFLYLSYWSTHLLSSVARPSVVEIKSCIQCTHWTYVYLVKGKKKTKSTTRELGYWIKHTSREVLRKVSRMHESVFDNSPHGKDGSYTRHIKHEPWKLYSCMKHHVIIMTYITI